MEPIYFKPRYSYTLALSTTAATATRFVPSGIHRARVVSSVDAWVMLGAHPTAAVGAGVFMPAGHVETFVVDNGDTFAAITDSAASGNLNVVELAR